jgi:hypothetical protein
MEYLRYLQVVDIFGTPAANFLTIRKQRTVKTTCGAIASIVFFVFAAVAFAVLIATMSGNGSYLQQSIAVSTLPVVSEPYTLS